MCLFRTGFKRPEAPKPHVLQNRYEAAATRGATRTLGCQNSVRREAWLASAEGSLTLKLIPPVAAVLGLYPRSHNVTGRAPNSIELYPILDFACFS